MYLARVDCIGPNTVDFLLPPRCDGADGGEPVNLSQAIAKPARPRRLLRWRFSLRTLLVMQLLCGAAVAPLIVRIHSFRAQHAIAAQFAGRQHCHLNGDWPKPVWLWKAVTDATGIKAMDITRVTVDDRPLRKHEAEQISQLPFVEDIHLGYGVLEDDALAPLARLPRLQRLDLRDCEKIGLSDKKLAPVRDYPALKHLTLESVNVTDAGIAQLAASDSIENLDIHYAKLYFEGLRPWIARNRLRSLRVPTHFTSDEIEELSHLTSLRSLSLPAVKFEAAKHLATMPNLVQIEPQRFVPHETALKTLPPRIRVYINNNHMYRQGEFVDK